MNSEALLIASGQNLKRLLQQRGWGRRPFPTGAAAAVNPGDAVTLCLWLVVVMVHAGDALSQNRQSAIDQIVLAS